ncbi:adenylyltransferase/sulfurtransferase [Curtobacterium sp. PhB130]|uniref:ThiF family adenylyltransferase n=1 Tax=Curtobacterium sp. PhB130 TaxID=2485178 RepID=UPI000F4B423F|nr:ThiF family adenylyltransferase [Curtobacterium sp. PhB130]ROS75829.1 adenylyltransferase/sulfurtransferase [Curtobacterium sp. PhB130]
MTTTDPPNRATTDRATTDRATTDRATTDPLSPARRRLGSRTAALDAGGDRTLERLAAASVLVVGAGGLGAPVIAYLAGSGIARLTIVDPDTVDPSNLARQTLFGAADVGRPKAQVAADRARAVDPECRVEAVVDSFHPGMVAGHDVVVDAADSVVVTRAISDACAAARVPFVWGSVLGYDGQVSVFDDTGSAGGPAVDFHDLHPEVRPDEGSCALDGVLPALCGAVGSVMAAQVTALVAGLGEPLVGRVLSVDARRWRWTESPLRRGPGSRRPGPAAEHEAHDDAVRIAPAALAARVADPADPVVVVDVRTPAELSTGTIPGAVTPDQLHTTGTDSDTALVVVCARGPRAVAWAATVDRPTTILDGGMEAWRREGLPIV